MPDHPVAPIIIKPISGVVYFFIKSLACLNYQIGIAINAFIDDRICERHVDLPKVDHAALIEEV